MDVTKLSAGPNPPDRPSRRHRNPVGGVPVMKYELDKSSGAMVRGPVPAHRHVLPRHYGFIPQTTLGRRRPLRCARDRSGAGSSRRGNSMPPGRSLAHGDQAGVDKRSIAVPVDDLATRSYTASPAYRDLPEILREQNRALFPALQGSRKGKWTNIGRWLEPDATTIPSS